MCGLYKEYELICNTCGKLIIKQIITTVIDPSTTLENFYSVLKGEDTDTDEDIDFISDLDEEEKICNLFDKVIIKN
jgi:hypothetical protein